MRILTSLPVAAALSLIALAPGFASAAPAVAQPAHVQQDTTAKAVKTAFHAGKEKAHATKTTGHKKHAKTTAEVKKHASVQKKSVKPATTQTKGQDL